ncbi:hypothetical protein HMPREF1544_06662 [Mucor circinelloides 1006PhL]|uniref:DH domain-containing protein n=1 Tax=Mucor circinelloides f. circinelloides (strain 1006PhL) TaxID=1220926 RepID=S2JUW9_MUCC1|nr:hypothetical protein HMPREF1544_06662 [Mucor circinelloides 1006PhL]
MLSASTFASSSSTSSAGAFSASPGLSTPSSQYSHDSARKGSGNPLTELIETEQAYMETLKMIDSQIAPIWMKQMTSAAPDFSELLKYIHDILKVNKRFCMKLTRIAANPQTISELGDALMQWVNDLEVPYANYCRSFIPNLNQRSDILRNPSIQQLLQNLSASVSYEINLESLFNAPIQQLKYYKGLYSRLLEGTDAGRADHKLLTSANKRIDTIMIMSRGNNSVNVNYKDSNLPFIQTNFSGNSDLTTFERQVDCSRTADLYSGTQINYQLRISNPGTQLVMRDSFVMLPNENGPSIRVCLVLTTEVLVIARELSSNQFLLMYPAIPIGDITVKADSLDREIVGEYIIQFSVLGKKHLIMRADSKEIRSTWIGVEPDAPKSLILTPRTLSVAAQKKILSSSSMQKGYGIQLPPMPGNGSNNKAMESNKGANIRNTDIFTYYSENGGVSPLESSDEEDEEDRTHGSRKQGKSRDTIMDIYDNHFYDDHQDDHDEASKFPTPPLPSTGMTTKHEPMPQSVKILPHIPNVSQAQIHNVPATNEPTPPNKDRSNVKDTLPPVPPNKQQPVNGPVKDSSHVQMTYIQPPTAQMSTMAISPPIPQPNQLNNSTPSPVAIASSSSSTTTTTTQNMNHHNNKINPLPASPNGTGMKNNMDGGKPASPRAVEVQRVVLPEMMQAVTQNTDEYLSSSNKTQQNDKNRFQPVANNGMARPAMQPRSDSAPLQQQQQQQLPRSSSIRGQTQQQQQPPHHHHQQQQRPPMMQNNSYPNQQQQLKPLPGQPQPQMMMNNQQPPQNQYGYNARPMNSPPPQQQHYQQQPPQQQHQYRPMNGGGAPSPILANAGNNRRPPPPAGAQPSSPRLQQPPGRFNSPSPSLSQRQMNSVEDFGSPPHSPNMYNPGNDVRQILYSSSQCDVFHWNNQSWYAAEGQCLLQVRLTHSNRTCVAVQLQNTGQLYLNAWILPNTVIRQPSPTDVNISLYMGTKKENYLIHFAHPQDATVFANILHKAHQDSNIINVQQQVEEPLMDEPEVVDTVNVPQTLKPVMQCKAKLFIKNETSNWSTFGNVTMRISQQSPSMRMMIQIENDKSKLVSAIVKSGNVEKISSKRISFLLTDEVAKTSIVYMIHLREDQTGNKIIEYLRTKNAENGW